MSKKAATINIDYYSDALCIWAWIAQARLDELHNQWGERVSVRHRYLDVFGDSHGKITKQWGAGDGFEKFGDHVAKSAAGFKHLALHPGLWTMTRPRSSTPSHLLLKAVEVIGGQAAVASMALAIRNAFFSRGQDISGLALLLDLAVGEGFDRAALEGALMDGQAAAALSSDQRSANELGLKGSPTWVLNNGRQILYGNVGYRILHANIEELANHPITAASWC